MVHWMDALRAPQPRFSITVPPPSPHRIPSVAPPKPGSGLKCAILAQFGVSGALGGGREERGSRGVSVDDI
jgi:hypothetical protein